MSALVGYESSGEEEPCPPTRVASLEADKPAVGQGTSLTTRNGITERRKDTAVEVRAEPPPIFVGPIPRPEPDPNGPPVEEAQSPPSLEDMSERNAIRYLTQASVPVTSIPPSPPGSPDPAANERFARFLQLKAKGIQFNEDLAKKTSYRNPNLLATMITHAGLEENAQYATSLPHELWHPNGFPELAYREGLLKSQREIQAKDERSKKTLSAAGKRTIEFESCNVSGSSSRKNTPGQLSKRRRPA